jgi:hypothetical protein
MAGDESVVELQEPRRTGKVLSSSWSAIACEGLENAFDPSITNTTVKRRATCGDTAGHPRG